MLEVYLNDKQFVNSVKKIMSFACDTAEFLLETKYAGLHFKTGSDGYFAELTVYKQYYGMNLTLEFHPDMFAFEEIRKKMLYLFPERK